MSTNATGSEMTGDTVWKRRGLRGGPTWAARADVDATAYMFTACRLMAKDDIVWLLAEVHWA